MTTLLPKSVTAARKKKIQQMMVIFDARQKAIKDEQERLAFERKVKEEAIRINEARRLNDEKFDKALEKADVALQVQKGKIKQSKKRSLIAKGKTKPNVM
tara:strand:- start:168 stop:467 length:300 start_codon:yes stop_codon:yes gene_type:complete